jgi:hypothetical protein
LSWLSCAGSHAGGAYDADRLANNNFGYSLSEVQNIVLFLLRRFRTPQVFMMLGEAYLRIQEPGKAIAAFQEALKVGY